MVSVYTQKELEDYSLVSKEVFDLEIEQLQIVRDRIGPEMNEAVELIYNSKGRVVITGIGKSGIIGKKIAASLASTGTHAFFMNSAEGLHGDLGIIDQDDVVIAISNSGNSEEVISLLPSIERIGCKIIAMTGNPSSPLGKAADIILNIGVEKEACPMNLAPTSSTTATLLMGDALTVSLINKRDFKPEKFAVYHPGGSLGRKLLSRVKDLMHTDLPIVLEDAKLSSIVYEISSKKLGMTLVYNANGKAVGIITDGDIRRALEQRSDVTSITAKEVMVSGFKYLDKEEMAIRALEYMEEYKITSVIVLDKENKMDVVGILTIHDLINFK